MRGVTPYESIRLSICSPVPRPSFQDTIPWFLSFSKVPLDCPVYAWIAKSETSQFSHSLRYTVAYLRE
jgi:hypothetical protein